MNITILKENSKAMQSFRVHFSSCKYGSLAPCTTLQTCTALNWTAGQSEMQWNLHYNRCLIQFTSPLLLWVTSPALHRRLALLWKRMKCTLQSQSYQVHFTWVLLWLSVDSTSNWMSALISDSWALDIRLSVFVFVLDLYLYLSELVYLTFGFTSNWMSPL